MGLVHARQVSLRDTSFPQSLQAMPSEPTAFEKYFHTSEPFDDGDAERLASSLRAAGALMSEDGFSAS